MYKYSKKNSSYCTSGHQKIVAETNPTKPTFLVVDDDQAIDLKADGEEMECSAQLVNTQNMEESKFTTLIKCKGIDNGKRDKEEQVDTKVTPGSQSSCFRMKLLANKKSK